MVWAIVGLKGLGGLLFVVGNVFGAYLLVRTHFISVYKYYSKLSLVVVLTLDFHFFVCLGCLLGGR